MSASDGSKRKDGSRAPKKRRYDLARSLLNGGAAEPTCDSPDEELMEHRAESPPQPVSAQDLPLRPPPGSAAVRPSAPVPKTPERASPEVLAATAERAFVGTMPDGSSMFEVEFRDDVFENLTCSVTISDGRVIATFMVADENLRRLLEAESGKLRARLEGRGLKVQDVRIQVRER